MKHFTLPALLAIALGCIGCETEPASSPVSIRPSSATIRAGESITFTASAGYDHRWALANNSIGTISSETGPQTTYTSIQDSPGTESTVQTLTLTSTIGGSAGNQVTNGTPYQASDQAFITHLPAGSSGTTSAGGGGTTTLSISPTAVELPGTHILVADGNRLICRDMPPWFFGGVIIE